MYIYKDLVGFNERDIIGIIKISKYFNKYLKILIRIIYTSQFCNFIKYPEPVTVGCIGDLGVNVRFNQNL